MAKKYKLAEQDLLFVEESDIAFQSIYTPDNSSRYHEKSVHGIEKKSVELIMKKLQLTFKEMSDLLHISERTYHRYKSTDKMDLSVSEKSLQLDELYRHGRSVFDTDSDFARWLKLPSPALNGKAPISFLTTSFGFNIIHDELGRIQHGIFS